MDLGRVTRPLSGFVLGYTLLLVVPLVVAYQEATRFETLTAFTAALATGLAAAGLLWMAGRRGGSALFRREGLSVVGLAWLFAGTLGAIPFKWSGAIPGAVDALFESVSGLTTTGATVLGSTPGIPTIEELPKSILLWRSMLQWMGGIGIILVFIVLLPAMGVTGSRLLSSEQVGVSDEANRPRMVEQARRLFLVYVVLTVAAGLSYWLIEMDAFEAACHAMTTIATAGFSTRNASIGAFDNVGVELVATLFMFLAGCNFMLLAGTLLRGGRARSGSPIAASEFRVYLGLTIVIVLGLTLALWGWHREVPDGMLGTTHDYREFGTCLRHGLFQGVCILTTTGYSTADFQLWPKLAIYLLLVSMFIGGCTGSTAGGFKVLRNIVCFKLLGFAIRGFVRPRIVERVKVGGQPVPDSSIVGILALLLLWVLGVVVGAFVLGLDPRLDGLSCLTTSLSMMCCIGPSITGVTPALEGVGEALGPNVGPYGGYGLLHPLTKLFMAGQMLLGRLEILAPVALLTPGFWRR